MTAAFEWAKGQQNLATFVMIDGSGGEVTGLGAGLTMQIAKAGGAFAAVGGTQAEMGSGWYSYLSTAAEADTDGPVSVTATGAGAIQQNLEYVVTARNIQGVFYTYTVTDSVSSLPIAGAVVSISTDIAGSNVVFSGVTDSLGVLRHISTNQKPFLDPNPYYFWTSAAGYTFTNPDLETVS
jgi:hypothetical protein